ncbi:hypothetical protein NPIL_84301 [Nephila pilipes]|uniref:Uncharacterized protein n=1 Tax=Nephila pilipes TaxID=299642 RepID=A0A8X6N7M7_NEPPI|nr:hypothetical protein NPIL_84301 [Nephila pilipes]
MLLLAIGVFTQSEDDGGKAEFLAIRTCISQSGNQTLCDQFLECGYELPTPVAVADVTCIYTIHPRGPGNCSSHEELYGDTETRAKITACVDRTQTRTLTDEQNKQMEDFKQCVRNVGKACLEKN